jgi:hypothetical protein
VDRESEYVEIDRAGPAPEREVQIQHEMQLVVLPEKSAKELEKEGMWTEITKDLVTREAIERLGYECEETEVFFYVLQYLSFDEVQSLVDLSAKLRRARRRRIRDLAREREGVEQKLEKKKRRQKHRHRSRSKKGRRPGPEEDYEERIIEREVVYDGPPPPRREFEERVLVERERDVLWEDRLPPPGRRPLPDDEYGKGRRPLPDEGYEERVVVEKGRERERERDVVYDYDDRGVPTSARSRGGRY